MPIDLNRLLAAEDIARAATLLDDDVVFHSPVADYRGSADVAHLLTKIASCISTPEAREQLAGAESTATTFVTAVDGRRLDGVFVQRCTPDDLLAEATLLIRPLAALRVAIARMQEALAADPLPSAR